MKFIIPLMCLIAFPVYAGGKHETHIHNTYNSIDESYYQANGVAASMAGDAIDFSRDTEKWQVGAGIAEFGNSQGIAIGASKRYNDININLKLMAEDNNDTRYGYSIGVVSTF